MNKDKTIQIAVIGAGYWGPNHIRVFNATAQACVKAVCDIDENRLQAIQNQFPNLQTTTEFKNVLADSDVDAVVIALPAEMHYQYAKQALLAGKHVLVEKPLTTNSTQAEELIALANKNKCVLMVGHTFEYNAVVRKIKSIIDSGELGSLFYIFCQRLNLGRLRNDVNVLWNLAPHDISIVNYWLKPTLPKRICAKGFHHLGTPQCDTGYINMEYDNGVFVHIVNSWLNPEKVRKITIVGSSKMLVYDDVSVDAKLQIFDKGVVNWDTHSDFGEFQIKVRSGDLLIPKIDFKEPLAIQANDFIHAIQTGQSPCANGRVGANVVRLLELAQQSMAAGGTNIELESQALHHA